MAALLLNPSAKLISANVALPLLSHICMTLGAEALDILAYLKTDSGRFISLQEISRRASGRRRFEESPAWAKRFVPLLLDAGLIEVNSRGHYRLTASAQPPIPAEPAAPTPPKSRTSIVGDDYFPTSRPQRIVGGGYFPETD